MKNLKIGMKLVVGFGLVLIMMAALIAVGITSLLSTNNGVLTYADRTLPEVNIVWQMRRDLVSMQRYMLLALAEDDINAIKNNLEMVASDGQRFTEALASYTKSGDADAAQVDSLQKLATALAPVREQISTLLTRGTAADNAKALQLFNNTYKPGVDEIAKIAEEIGVTLEQHSQTQRASAQSSFLVALTAMVATAVVAVLLTIFMVILISRAITKPVAEIEIAMRALAAGDLDNATLTYHAKDELGTLSEDIRSTITRLSFIIKDMGRSLTAIADGDFTHISEDDKAYTGAFSKMSEATSLIISRLSRTLGQISTASDQVAAGSDQVSSGAQALSQGATEQASAVEELAATISEISSQVRQNAASAKQASEMAQGSTVAIESSNDQMQHLMGSMHEIDAKSKEIGKIIKTIEDIAFQTNILALNAAVEAARAGAAGKGFAVVADEVRNLAGKSAEAAQNTTSLIESSIAAINTGVNLAQATAGELVGVVAGSKQTAKVIQEITAASNEQSQAIAQITTGLDQISAVVQTNSATSEESAAASEELSAQAQTLKQLLSAFVLAGSSASSGDENPSSAEESNAPVRYERKTTQAAKASSLAKTASKGIQSGSKY